MIWHHAKICGISSLDLLHTMPVLSINKYYKKTISRDIESFCPISLHQIENTVQQQRPQNQFATS